MKQKLLKEIYNTLAKGYDWLYHQAIDTGHWGDIRSTALSSIALELREPINSKWLSTSRNWLLGEQTSVNDTYFHWNEEVWDTAMAIFSLNQLHLNQKDPRYQKTIDWIENLFNKTKRQNWHDEPWETSWALIAILEGNNSQKYFQTIVNSLDWLLSFKSSNGMIIAPHYTAYYIMIFSKLNNAASQYKFQLDEKYSKAADEATYYLVNEIKPDILWNGEAWANGQILWALCYAKRFPVSNENLIDTVVNWFALNQESDNGNWEDEEDTASALIGLCHLLMRMEEIENYDELRRRLRDKYETPDLRIKPKFIEHHSNGYYSVNLSPFLLRAAIIISTVISGIWLILEFGGYLLKLFQ
jgi:hypothetical protein